VEGFCFFLFRSSPFFIRVVPFIVTFSFFNWEKQDALFAGQIVLQKFLRSPVQKVPSAELASFWASPYFFVNEFCHPPHGVFSPNDGFGFSTSVRGAMPLFVSPPSILTLFRTFFCLFDPLSRDGLTSLFLKLDSSFFWSREDTPSLFSPPWFFLLFCVHSLQGERFLEQQRGAYFFRWSFISYVTHSHISRPDFFLPSSLRCLNYVSFFSPLPRRTTELPCSAPISFFSQAR